MGALSPLTILGIIGGYFLLLILISFFTSRDSDNHTFFTANRDSSWILVAIGMIGASLSGVTFISIPGVVGKTEGANINFAYMQMVLGYLVGYFIIATVLMPIYYKYNLTTIYGYLEKRLGFFSYKTGAAFFLLSRIIGASFRLYLVAMVLNAFVTGPMGVPFLLTVVITIGLIWLYTFRGGIKTIVVTDTFQTVAMLTAVVLTIYGIMSSMNLNIGGMIDRIQSAGYSKMFYFDNGWSDPNNFFKQFISGALIALVMTGLDQDMMQKNLTCRTLGDAQKNVFLFSIVLIFANILFLTLGAMLYLFAADQGVEIPARTDQLFPLLALNYLSPAVGVFFILGLIAAAYSSADSALTALTTSFSVDFLGLHKKEDNAAARRTRLIVHIGFSIILLLMIVLFNVINDDSVINNLFKAATYTYGPILGLFSFSILTKRGIKDQYVIPICIMAPLITYYLDTHSVELFNGFKFGFLSLLLNGILTFLGLWMISYPQEDESEIAL